MSFSDGMWRFQDREDSVLVIPREAAPTASERRDQENDVVWSFENEWPGSPGGVALCREATAVNVALHAGYVGA